MHGGRFWLPKGDVPQAPVRSPGGAGNGGAGARSAFAEGRPFSRPGFAITAAHDGAPPPPRRSGVSKDSAIEASSTRVASRPVVFGLRAKGRGFVANEQARGLGSTHPPRQMGVVRAAVRPLTLGGRGGYCA